VNFTTPFAGMLPDHDPETLEQLRTSLRDEGQKHEIEVTTKGEVLDGNTRLRLLRELGREVRYRIVEGLASRIEEELYVLRTAGQVRRLSPSDQQCWRKEQTKRVLELRVSDPKRWTQEALAKLAQVGQQTISRWLRCANTHERTSANPPAGSVEKPDARKKYPLEQVRRGLQLVANGVPISEAARLVGMPENALFSRKRTAEKRGAMPAPETAASTARTKSTTRARGWELTQEQDAQFRRLYPSHTWAELGELMGLKSYQVADTVRRLGLVKPKSRRANPLDAVENFLGTVIRSAEHHLGEDARDCRYGGTRDQYSNALTMVEGARKAIKKLREQLTAEQEETA